MERERLGSFHPKPYGHTAWQRAPPVSPSGLDSAAPQAEPLQGWQLLGQGAAGVRNSKKSGPSSVVGSLCVCVKCVWVCRHVHSFAHLLPEKSYWTTVGMDSEASHHFGVALLTALLLFVFFCLNFYIFLRAMHCRISFYHHLDLVNILNTELYRVFMMLWNILNLHNHQPSTFFLCIIARHTAIV